MANPAFPNVPPFPGVPALARAAGSALVPQIARLTADAPSVTQQLGTAEKQRWGIYSNDGVNPAAVADSVLSVDYDKEFQIPTYPMEDGTFQSYNKVARPREMTVKLAKGGPKYDRERFLNRCASVLDDTKLYSVVQPERFYPNMNFVRMRYDRSNPQMLVVELSAEEVRLTASLAFSSTKSPNDANAANQGNVATQEPTSAQVATLSPPQ
jgi:hypothetical protein